MYSEMLEKIFLNQSNHFGRRFTVRGRWECTCFIIWGEQWISINTIWLGRVGHAGRVRGTWRQWATAAIITQAWKIYNALNQKSVQKTYWLWTGSDMCWNECCLMTPGLRKDIQCHQCPLTLLTTCGSPNQTHSPRTVHLRIFDDHFYLPKGRGLCGHLWVSMDTYHPKVTLIMHGPK